jgi:hypothetical protein
MTTPGRKTQGEATPKRSLEQNAARLNDEADRLLAE